MNRILTENDKKIQYYTIPHLKTVQKYLLELLIIIDKVAKINNIDYWIDGGTLLGAVRHGGFIPWDDDVDVCLLKKDYDRFLPLLNDYIKNNDDLSLMYFGKDVEHWDDFLMSKKYPTRVKGEKKPMKIDIFPMKLLRNDEHELKNDKYLTDTANFFIMGETKYFPEIKNKYKFKSLSDALYQKNKFLKTFNNQHIKKNIDLSDKRNLFVDYPFGDSYVKAKRDYKKYSDIFPLKSIEFEGYTFNCPQNINNYLKGVFNDYMSLPSLPYRKPASNKIYINDTFTETDYKKFIHNQNSYFYYSNKPIYKLKVLLRHIKYNGLKGGYDEIIKPFFKKILKK
jgi:lipopolysaccharide cholinephosphotransferase